MSAQLQLQRGSCELAVPLGLAVLFSNFASLVRVYATQRRIVLGIHRVSHKECAAEASARKVETRRGGSVVPAACTLPGLRAAWRLCVLDVATSPVTLGTEARAEPKWTGRARVMPDALLPAALQPARAAAAHARLRRLAI